MTIAEKVVSDLSQDEWRAGISASVNQLIELSKGSRDNEIGVFADIIEQDSALASKVIEAANSAHFRNNGRGLINTVSSAVLLLGIETTRQLAMSLSLMDKLFEPEQRALLHEDLACAMMACSLASKLMDEVGGNDRDMPEVATMVKGLGRLVTAAYAYSEYLEVRANDDSEIPAINAEMAILGASFDELAVKAVAQLDMPTRYDLVMADPLAAKVSTLAIDLAQALVSRGLSLNDEAVGAALEGLVTTFDISRSKAVSLAESAMRSYSGVKASLKARAIKDVANAQNKPAVKRRKAHTIDENAERLIIRAKATMETLAASGADSRVIAQVGLELLLLEGNFRNVLYFENRGYDTFQARASAGVNAGLKSRMWVVTTGLNQSLLGMALLKGTSVHIGNVADPRFARKVPEWITQSLGPTGSFTFIPLGGGPCADGFIYCDKEHAEATVGDQIQSTLKRVKAHLIAAIARAKLIKMPEYA